MAILALTASYMVSISLHIITGVISGVTDRPFSMSIKGERRFEVVNL